MLVTGKKVLNKGFTLVELVVAIGVLLILGVAVSALILSHIHDSKLAAVTSDIAKVAVAVRTSSLHEGGRLKDVNGDGDFLDDIIDAHYLDRKPTSVPGGTWMLKSINTTSGQVNYYVEVLCNNEACAELLLDLDEHVDSANGADHGLVQWTN